MIFIIDIGKIVFKNRPRFFIIFRSSLTHVPTSLALVHATMKIALLVNMCLLLSYRLMVLTI